MTDRTRVVIGTVALVAGLAAGAWLDWHMWHPMSSIVATMGFGLLLLVGLVAALIRQRIARSIAVVLLSVAVGGFAGQALGPARPTILRTDTGSIRLILSGADALDARGGASCGFDAAGDQIVVDPDEFGVARPTEDADFHYVDIAIGDMWDFGDPHARADHVTIRIRVIPALVTAAGEPDEISHETDAASVVELGRTSTTGGSVTFSNLVVDGGSDSGSRSPLRGTVTWTCGAAVPTTGEA
jgi:hypothetical protein